MVVFNTVIDSNSDERVAEESKGNYFGTNYSKNRKKMSVFQYKAKNGDSHTNRPTLTT